MESKRPMCQLGRILSGIAYLSRRTKLGHFKPNNASKTGEDALMINALIALRSLRLCWIHCTRLRFVLSLDLELCSSLNNPTDFPDNMDGAMNKPAYLNEHIDNCKCLQLRTSLHVDIKPDNRIFHFSSTQLKKVGVRLRGSAERHLGLPIEHLHQEQKRRR